MNNHEKSRAVDEHEPFQEIDPAVLLRIRQLGDTGLRKAMQVLDQNNKDI